MNRSVPREFTTAGTPSELAASYTASTGKATLNKTEAAKFLGVSVDHFDAHIEGTIRVVRSGRRRMYRVLDLFEWLDEHADARIAA